jgi:tetratricopeptide (TPR) repeat protein
MLLSPILLLYGVAACEANLASAAAALRQNDPAKALAILEPFRATCSNSSAFQELVGLASELSGNAHNAEQALEAAVSLDPMSARLLTELGATYLRNGNAAGAASTLDRALVLDPSNVGAMKYAAAAAVRLKAWPRAAALFHQMKAEENLATLQQEPVLVLWFAQALIETNQSERIDSIFSQARKQMDPPLLFALATLFAEHQMYALAVDYLRAVPAEDADDAVCFNLGLSYSHLKVFDKARESYFQAIDKHPDHADAYLHVGLDYVASGDPHMGIPWLFKAHSLTPGRTDISYALIEQLISLGYLDTAKEVLGEAANSDTRDALLLVADGDVQFAAHELTAASESYQRAIAQRPGLTPALVGLARVSVAQGRESEARTFLKDALSASRQDPPANGELGLLEAQHGEWDGALEHLNRSWSQDHSNTKIAFELARVYRHKSRPQEALQLLLSLQPAMRDSSPFHFELAQLYTELRRPINAQTERDEFSRLQADTQDSLHFVSPRTYVH